MVEVFVKDVVNKGETMGFLNISFKVVLFLWLLLCSWQDIKDQQISIILIAAGFVALFVVSLIQGQLALWERIAGVGIGFILLILNKVTRGQIGIGDGLIFCVIGISLGFIVNSILLIYSLFIAAIFSGLYMIIKKANRKTTIPFVPFIFIASMGVYFSE